MGTFPPVLILAGGLGTRIADLAGDLPKSMVPVAGHPFIFHQLRLLAEQDVKHVVLCVGHRSEPLIDYVGDGNRFGLQVQYSSDGDRLLGTGGAIIKASKLVGSPFAVLYGDSYLDIDFAPAYQAFIQSGKKALMTVYRNENKLIPSNLLFKNGMIVAYNKTNPSPEMQHVDFGLSFFNRSAFPQELPDTPLDLGEVVQQLIAQGRLAGFETTTRFFEVGTAQGIRDLEQYFATRD